MESGTPFFRPARPSTGTKTGRPIQLKTNHFALSLKNVSMIRINSYNILPDPGRSNRQARQTILKKVEEQLAEALGAFMIAGWTIYSTKKLDEVLILGTIWNDTEYQIKVSHTKSFDPSVTLQEEEMLQGKQFVSILIKKYLRAIKLSPIGRNEKYFDFDRTVRFDNLGLNLIPGFHTAVRSLQDGLFLNLDVNFKILRQETVLGFIKGDSQKKRVEALLVGRSCMAGYGNNRVYHIDEICWKMTPKDTFDMGGKATSYMQYYDKVYNIKISDPNQPMIHSIRKVRQTNREKVEEHFFLVPELMYLSGLTDAERADFRVMRELAEHTKLTPGQRDQQVTAVARKMTSQATIQKIAKEGSDPIGLNIVPETHVVTGRVLEAPKIEIGGKQLAKLQQGGGNFDLRGKVFQPSHLNQWIMFYAADCEKDSFALWENLQKAGQTLGIRLEEPYFHAIRDMRQIVDEIDGITEEATNFCMFLFKRRDKRAYEPLKQRCCGFGIPSQVIHAESLRKNTFSVCSKLLLQCSAKLGATLWRVQPTPGFPARSMIVGIDVCHKTIKGRGYDFLGFCASFDPFFSRYTSYAVKVPKNQEISECVAECMRKALITFQKKAKSMPTNIFVYRDGVSDTQREEVLSKEVTGVENLLTNDEIAAKSDIKMTYIIVNKRINTKFLDVANQNGKIKGNPPPGTVVDSGVASTHHWDFYLVPQAVTQGTATPSHYHVVYDSAGIGEGLLQAQTFKFCFGYFNWSGPIRVPAACQYAHKLAFIHSECNLDDLEESNRLKYMPYQL